MHKKIIAVLAAALTVISLASCGVSVIEETTTAEETTAEESTTEVTTLPETTTEQATTLPETTAAPTTKKKVTTTKKPTVKTTVAATNKKEAETKKETETVKETKYGVIVVKNVTLIYEVLSDGTEKKVGESVSTVSCTRLGYSASYDDLLPAAKENRQKYKDFINEVLRITNGYRAAEGIAPLTLKEDLTVMSCVRAEELAWSGDHDHYRPGGKYFSSIFREIGYTEGSVGENLGWGFATPEAVCEAWKASKTHYENMMNPNFTEVGLGVAADADPEHNYCWTQHFYAAESEE